MTHDIAQATLAGFAVALALVAVLWWRRPDRGSRGRT
jgi:hypothetical protein